MKKLVLIDTTFFGCDGSNHGDVDIVDIMGQTISFDVDFTDLYGGKLNVEPIERTPGGWLCSYTCGGETKVFEVPIDKISFDYIV